DVATKNAPETARFLYACAEARWRGTNQRLKSRRTLPRPPPGSNVHCFTALTAADSNVRDGRALTTETLSTLPSALTVNSTSTKPTVRLRAASAGYVGSTRLIGLSAWALAWAGNTNASASAAMARV